MFCPYCGEENINEAQYCQNCGKKIPIKDDIKYSKKTDQLSEKKKDPHSTAIAVGWLGVLFFVPLGFIMGLYLISQPEQRAKKNGWWMLGISLLWGFIVVMFLL